MLVNNMVQVQTKTMLEVNNWHTWCCFFPICLILSCHGTKNKHLSIHVSFIGRRETNTDRQNRATITTTGKQTSYLDFDPNHPPLLLACHLKGPFGFREDSFVSSYIDTVMIEPPNTDRLELLLFFFFCSHLHRKLRHWHLLACAGMT